MAVAWTFSRTGNRVQMDLTRADGFTHEDTQAIGAALEAYLTDDSVTMIKLGGPVLMYEGPPDGLGPAIRHIGDLARAHGKRFDVGPI